jgi:predicted enzyme related to lactoylglutathione lyase
MKTHITNFIKQFGGIFFISLALSCSTGKDSFPIAEDYSNEARNGEIVWIDMVTNDAESGKKFFSELLGWEFKSYGPYTMSLSNTKPVAGIIQDAELMKGTKNSYWVVSFAVSDVKSISNDLISKGGKSISNPMKIDGRGTSALVTDKQGALFSILESEKGFTRASKPRNGEWLWAELWTKNVPDAVEFYTTVLPIKASALKGEGTENYYILKGQSHEFGAITDLPVKDEEPIWIPVLRVKSAPEIAKKAEELGGSVLINPASISGNEVALIATPNGAPFLVQEWKE